jgi:hypothetical protein
MHRTEGAHGQMTNEAHSGNKGGASAVFRSERAIRQMDARFAVQAKRCNERDFKQ